MFTGAIPLAVSNVSALYGAEIPPPPPAVLPRPGVGSATLGTLAFSLHPGALIAVLSPWRSAAPATVLPSVAVAGGNSNKNSQAGVPGGRAIRRPWR
jgi:hypothetical protein